MDFSKFLLPRYYKLVGALFVILSMFLAFDRFYLGHKYHFLKFKVFTFYSEFLFTRKFSFTRNYQGEELVVLLAIIGLALMAFSQEKHESIQTNKLRQTAILLSFVVNILITIVGTIFLHGLGYFYFLSILLIIPIFLYNLFFLFLYYRNVGVSID